MKKRLFIFLACFSLLSCVDQEKTNDCPDDLICTLEYVVINVSVVDKDDQPVVLDSYKVTNMDTGVEVVFADSYGSSSYGLYPLIADNMLNVGVEQELLFQGYVNHQEIVSGSFVAEQDCCHVSLVSGGLNLIVAESYTDCDQIVLQNQDLYANAPDDFLTIISTELNGDCLTINFGASGCDGNTWELKLIDSEAVLESFPVQRNLRLSLKNDEECDAYFTKELSFDLSTLQIESYDTILLNIEGYATQIEYKY